MNTLPPAIVEVKPAATATIPTIAIATDDDGNEWFFDDATLEAMADESAAYEEMMSGAYAY